MTSLSFLRSALSVFLVVSFSACQIKPIAKESRDRQVASLDDEDRSFAKHLQTFKNLMNENDEKKRLESIKDFMDRQRSFYYIGYELMVEFDVRLDALLALKDKGQEISAKDFQGFNEMRFKNLIAFEFMERNQSEILDLYRLTLQNSVQKRSPYFKKSQQILTYVERWMEDGWAKGDKGAIILLAHLLEDATEEVFPKRTPKGIPVFFNYTKLGGAVLQEAYTESQYFAKSREKEAVDYFIQRKWEEHLVRRERGLSDLFSELYDARTPQALDTLEPDAGSKGHVTGNRFPRGKWALTYDDGPNPTNTSAIYENLKSTGTHATFFWLTQNMIKFPDLVKKAGEMGFSRASHSFSHQNLPTLKPAALNHEVNEALDGFKQVVGQPATLFRCPYGACGGNDSDIRKMIAGRQALEIFWNVDTLDWQDKNPQSIFQRSRKQVDLLGRGIILFHDIHPQSVIASKLLMEYIKSSPNMKIAPLKDLIGESRGKDFASP